MRREDNIIKRTINLIGRESYLEIRQLHYGLFECKERVTTLQEKVTEELFQDEYYK
jgi:hypothetical protein